MKLKAALKKLEKFGTVKVENGVYSVIKDNRKVSFMISNGYDLPKEECEICCIQGQGVKDKDDLMTDYHGGVFYKNLTQATKRWAA